MRNIIIIPLLFFCVSSFCQDKTLQSAANDAFLVTRMAEKFHLQPKPVNDVFSSDMISLLLKDLDEDKIYFTREDINVLEKFRYKLDDEINNRKTAFLE